MTSQNLCAVRLTARQQAIYDFIRAHQPVSALEVAVHFEVSVSTATNHLQAIRKARLIAPSGNNRWARWSEQPVSQRRAPVAARVNSVWDLASHAQAD